MSPPLAGIRVLEIATMIAAPQAAQLLASYGAQVIKIEDTLAGDPLRFYGSQKNGMSGWYANANAGKQSFSVDLKSDFGREAVQRLAADADVLIEGFRTGVLDRLELGWETLQAINPRLVYCSSTGFGPDGPYSKRPAYDPLIQALSGWAGAQQVDDNPTLIAAMAADKVGAYNNVQAIMAALIQRERTGAGCHIQTNMLDANLAFVWPDTMMHETLRDPDATHRPNLLGSYRLYTAADGWVAIAAGTDAHWEAACVALDRPDLHAHEHLRTSAGRAAHIAEWYDLLDEMALRFPAAEVVRRLVEADVPAALVLAPDAVFDDPHVRSTGFVTESEHPTMGLWRHPRARADQFGGTLSLSPAPALGEQTRELLLGVGFTEHEIDAQLAAGSIRTRS